MRKFASWRRRSVIRRLSGVRGEEAQSLKREADFKARRWIVERTPNGMNRFRRILIRGEKHAASYLSMLHLACGLITWRFGAIGIGS